MHILIFNHYAGSPYHGMEYRPYYLAKEWIKTGHTVTIIASTQSHVRTNNPAYDAKITRETIDGIHYIWIKTRTYKGNGAKRVFNMFDYIKGVYKLVPELVKEKPNAVIASSTYPFDNYPVYKIAKKSGAQFVYEIHDLWPLSPMQLGGYSKWHPFMWLLQRAENFAYKHVDKVVSIIPCAKEHTVEHGLDPSKFFHIPNGISLEEVSDREPLNDKTASLLPKNKFIIGYAGTLGLANSLDTFLEAASMIQNDYPDILLVIVGKGPEKENLTALQQKLDLHNVLFIDSIPKKQVQSMLSCFDACFITLQKQPLFQFGISPNKLFDYMYSGKPIVQAIKAGNDIVSDAHCGFTIEPENPKALADIIVKMYKLDAKEREAMGRNGKQFVLKNHTYEVLAKKFIDIFAVL